MRMVMSFCQLRNALFVRQAEKQAEHKILLFIHAFRQPDRQNVRRTGRKFFLRLSGKNIRVTAFFADGS